MTNGIRIPSDISILMSYFLKIRDTFFDPYENPATLEDFELNARNSKNYEESMTMQKSAIFRNHNGKCLGKYCFFITIRSTSSV